MKKKLLLVALMVFLFACMFVITASAETPSMYIEFGAKFPGSTEYITVYTENAESSGNPQINFATKKFYSDVDFTQEVDMSTAIGIDFSVAKSYVNGVQGTAPNRMTAPSSPFVNCVEVKWFLAGMPSVSYNGSFFKGWTGLKSFDFGNATSIADNTFEGCGLESITIPASITSIGGSAFKDCISLKSVVFEGAVTKFNNGQTFYGCTALETVDLGTCTTTGGKMFYKCSSLKSIVIPNTITRLSDEIFYGSGISGEVIIPASVTSSGNNIFKECTGITKVVVNGNLTGSNAFYGCTGITEAVLGSNLTTIPGGMFGLCSALTSVTIPEGVSSIGGNAFLKSGITSLHVPASVTYLGYQVAEESAIQTLTFAAGSQLKHIDHRAFMSCKSLEGVVIIPEGVEDIEYGLFSSCTKLKAVKLPSTFTTSSDYGVMFGSCSSLEFVQLGGMTTIPGSMFEGCTSLKAISIPEGVTAIGEKALRNCTSLQAIYLPSTLTTLGITSTGTDKGVFYQSKSIYFVQEPFEVFNGDTLIGDSFVMPTKPDVYYMPSLLNFVGNSEFQNCNKINKVVVFPTGVTSVAGCSQGAFQGIGSSTSPVTIVFLGDITAFQIQHYEKYYAYVSFVFANSADKSIDDINFTIGSSKNNKEQTNSYMYFCAGNVVYDLSSFVAPAETLYTVQETDFTKSEGTTHFSDPRKAVVTPADCLNARAEDQTCFCGFDMPSVTIGSALGHEHDLTKGATITDILFENGYTANGCKEIKCARCDEKDYNSVVEALFNNVRYSVAEKGFGICVNYNVNKDALAVCKDAGKAVSFGVVAIMADKVENNGPLANDGTVSTQNNVIAADVTADNLCAVTLKIVGDESAWKANAEKAIYVLGYATNGTDLEYLGSVSEIAADRNNIASVKSLVIGQFFDFNV